MLGLQILCESVDEAAGDVFRRKRPRARVERRYPSDYLPAAVSRHNDVSVNLVDRVFSRWYMESSYPTEVAHHIYKLGQTHGHAKISYTLMSKVRAIRAFVPCFETDSLILLDRAEPA